MVLELSPAADQAQDADRVRSQLEAERDLLVQLLHLANSPRDLSGFLREATLLLKTWTACEAVGVRLRDGDDFPYHETMGFPAQFVATENDLCTRDLRGQLARDEVGNPVLACMCGNVLCGRFDPALPFFTERGSFWTNSTTRLLAGTTEADRQSRTRNRCHGEGYESVALIPLRSGDATIGLLQINDHRPGMFTRDGVALLERLAEALAPAIARLQSAARLLAARSQLSLMERQLAHASRLAALGELAAGIAHEVNQSLCAVANFARACCNVLDRPNPDVAQVRGWCEAMSETAARGGEFVQRLGRFARRSAARRVPVTLRELVRDAGNLLRFELDSRGVALRDRLPAAALTVRVDPVQMQQVLVNLLRNALESFPADHDGPKFVTVRACPRRDAVEARVVDNGAGLSPADLARIFEPFHTTKSEGLGLGLSICKTIVEAHGGRLWASANAERGATLHIQLPLAHEGEADVRTEDGIRRR